VTRAFGKETPCGSEKQFAREPRNVSCGVVKSRQVCTMEGALSTQWLSHTQWRRSQ